MRSGQPLFVVPAVAVCLLCASTHCGQAGNPAALSSTGSHDASTSAPSPDSGSDAGSVGSAAPDGSSDTSPADALPPDALSPDAFPPDDDAAADAEAQAPVTGTLVQITIPAQGMLNGASIYYAWVPDGSAPVRSIIVHQHGCTREYDAPTMVHDLHWLQLAKKWRSVFVAPALITAPNCANWYEPSSGSASSFLQMLDSLAQMTNHAEISTVPWALWGHSGGAIWATAMAGMYPQRVVTVIAQACATDISGIPAALDIPILHHNSVQDLCYNNMYFTAGRQKGALWGYAINPNPLWVTDPNAFAANVEGHAPHDLRMLAIPWMDLCMSERLPAEPGTATLRAMDTSSAWLGDLGTLDVAPASGYAGDPLSACWFPDQTLAEKWKEYMVNGTLIGSTPPPAPYSLNGTFTNGTLSLTWSSDTSLESGLKTFVVYRDGVALQTLQYDTTTYFTFAKGFQRWQDGDNPDPSPPPGMTFADQGLDASQTHVYQVSAVDWSDLEGPKSQPLTLNHGQVEAPQN